MISKLRGLYTHVNNIVRRFKLCSNYVKQRLFSAFCSQINLCYLWSNFPSSTLRRFRISYNNCVRKIFKLPFICSVTGTFPFINVKTFDELLRFARGGFLLLCCTVFNVFSCVQTNYFVNC